ncbi:hypothetical protein [Xenorhabdus anantnagensis]|uniref:Uncharacterized protein n=1 Tax=Xenorhabdus anantnagensis TaxID=3025875 RepID=A0ABT5LXP6_9GAMM|nr:hypothetical protein [Xenorhabdus anantnagensis]MDC9597785.1 hypothetical protein [Xenorhabdus anantnagensis]
MEGTEEWIKYKQLEEKGNSPEYAALRDQLAKETLTIDVPQPDGTVAHYAFPMFQYGNADALADNLVYADGKYQISTRAGGLIQAAGGAVEIIGGTVSCGTGIGCAVGAVMATQGIDNLYTGSNILESGKPIKTMGAQGLEALGVPPEYSEITYAAIGLGGSVTTVLTSPKTGKTVTVLVDKNNRITKSFSDKGNNSGLSPHQSGGVIPNNTGLNDVTINKILSIEKGHRPDPTTYMPKAAIDAHLSKFDDGAIRFTSMNDVKRFGTIGPDKGFVMPKSEFDKLMAESKGNLSIVEEKLGLTKGYLSNSDTGVFYIPRSEFKNLNIPSGNENGANQYWLPGGKTSGGVSEAVMDFSHKPNVQLIDIKSFNKGKKE